MAGGERWSGGLCANNVRSALLRPSSIFCGIYFENTEAIQSLFELPVSVSYLETLILCASGKPRSTHRM